MDIGELNQRDKKFLLISGILLILILLILFIIVPIIKGTQENEKISYHAREVESHIKNIQYAMITTAFENSSIDFSVYDTASAYKLESLVSSNIRCSNYFVKDGTVLSAKSCSKYNWKYIYDYTNQAGAILINKK